MTSRSTREAIERVLSMRRSRWNIRSVTAGRNAAVSGIGRAATKTTRPAASGRGAGLSRNCRCNSIPTRNARRCSCQCDGRRMIGCGRTGSRKLRSSGRQPRRLPRCRAKIDATNASTAPLRRRPPPICVPDRENSRRRDRSDDTGAMRAAMEAGLFTALPPVDFGNPRYPLPAIRVFHVDDVAVRPVKVVGDEGYLLDQLIEGVAQDSPERAGSRRKWW